MSKVVLDASAVLTLLFGEPGADVVQKNLSGAVISAVNYSECLTKLIDQSIPIENGLLWLNKLNLTIDPFDVEVAAVAASLRAATGGRILSFTDRACLATARRRGGRAITADREWLKLKLDIAIECIRREPAKPDRKKH